MNYTFNEKLLIRYNMVLVEKNINVWLFNMRVTELDLSRFGGCSTFRENEPQASWSVLEDRVPLGVSGSGRVVRVSSQTRVRENDLVRQRLQAVVDDDHLQRLMGGEIPQRSWETQETHFTRTRTNNDSISRLDLGCFDSCGLSMKHWWNYNIQFNSIQFTLTDW